MRHAVLAVLAAPVFVRATRVCGQQTWAELAAADASTSGLGVPGWSVSVLPLGLGLPALRLLLGAVRRRRVIEAFPLAYLHASVPKTA